LRQVADLIGREQRPAGVVLREAQARPLAVERQAHGLEHYSFLAEQIGEQLAAAPGALPNCRLRELFQAASNTMTMRYVKALPNFA